MPAVLFCVAGTAMRASAPSFSPSPADLRARSREAAAHHGLLAHGRGAQGARTPRGPGRVALLAGYADMKAADLKALCRERGLKVSGAKAILIARLEEAAGEASPQIPQKKAPSPAPARKSPAPAKKPAQAPSEKKAPPSKATIEPGDRVMARYHRDNQLHPGILLMTQESGKYLISWDEPDDNEPLTSCTDVELLKKAETPLEPGKQQIFHVGDKVMARFPQDNGFYEAELLELMEGNRCKVKWDDPDGYDPIVMMPVGDIQLKFRAPSAC